MLHNIDAMLRQNLQLLRQIDKMLRQIDAMLRQIGAVSLLEDLNPADRWCFLINFQPLSFSV